MPYFLVARFIFYNLLINVFLGWQCKKRTWKSSKSRSLRLPSRMKSRTDALWCLTASTQLLINMAPIRHSRKIKRSFCITCGIRQWRLRYFLKLFGLIAKFKLFRLLWASFPRRMISSFSNRSMENFRIIRMALISCIVVRIIVNWESVKGESPFGKTGRSQRCVVCLTS